MDAVKFIEERNRMCRFYGEVCTGCPAHNTSGASTCLVGIELQGNNAEEQVQIVEQWSAAHPRKTRQSVFLEQYPDVNIGENGILLMCPAEISALHRNETGGCGHHKKLCADCRREFWMEEVE